MKKQLITVIAFASLSFAACSGTNNAETEAEAVEIEAAGEEIDEAIENLEAEEADMEHDVDSLLEGI